MLDLEDQLNIKIDIQSSLAEKYDHQAAETKVFDTFVHRASKLKKSTMDHLNSHGLIDQFRETYTSCEDEESRQRMLDLLILNYVESHLQIPHQIGFLTGLKTYQTYNLRIEFDPKLKKEYSSVREQLAEYLK